MVNQALVDMDQPKQMEGSFQHNPTVTADTLNPRFFILFA